ncbi:ATP-binding protein [Actinomadura sp. 9N215]|uniref:ATP-binding protein n=1 Tax=Actinomadura sp. 9N215 TaxID=3375150 RepID=UPI0037A3A853
MALLKTKTGVSRQFVASPAVSGLARDQVSGVLREWELQFLVSDAVLVMGELVANAVKVSGRGDAIKVYVGLRAVGVVLGVWDGSDERPVARNVEISLDTLDLSEENFDDNGGRGLAIVEALAWRCWTDPTPPHGKWVCAALRTEARR